MKSGNSLSFRYFGASECKKKTKRILGSVLETIVKPTLDVLVELPAD